MAKKVSKKTDTSLEVKTPYPKEENTKQQKSDTDFWGEKMVKLQDRINELELTVNSMHLKLNRVADRMGF
tara:strand:- start:328 stop:537 length:210 start_codon:yes stop_codon:yes gene_type:complete